MTDQRKPSESDIISFLNVEKEEKKDHLHKLTIREEFNRNKIRQEITDKNSYFFMNIFQKHPEKEIISVLENIGKLPEEFPYFIFEFLLKRYKNEKIKLLAVKNLGKTRNQDIAPILKQYYQEEKSTHIRREIVSSIGRIRSKENINWLLSVLNDEDPKVVMQAVRALLIFKGDVDVRNSLKRFENHRNETLREIVVAELAEDEDSFVRQKKIENIRKFLPLIRKTSVLGDAREVLKLLPDGCIQLTFTSPPYYNARDYSLYQCYEEYLDFLVEVFREVHRVTEEGRFFILNTSPVLIPRFSRKYSSHRYAIPFDIHPRIIDIGFEFIEDIIWMKPAPSAKNRNAGFYQHRKPLGYKANSITEYIIVYRKKTHKLIDWNMKQYSDDITEKSKINEDDYEKTNVWKIPPSSSKDHPAVFPDELVYWILRFYSFIGDLILDPFAGSGTVGKVCQQNKRNYFLAEIDDDYFRILRRELSKLDGGLLKTQKSKYFKYNEFKELINDFSLKNN
ncbi:MAG: DNA methyltransferase [Candidatus Hodarchaeota archaeon]